MRMNGNAKAAMKYKSKYKYKCGLDIGNPNLIMLWWSIKQPRGRQLKNIKGKKAV